MSGFRFGLLWLRLGLSVVFPAVFFLGGPGWLAVAALAVGLVSDIFDGCTGAPVGKR